MDCSSRDESRHRNHDFHLRLFDGDRIQIFRFPVGCCRDPQHERLSLIRTVSPVNWRQLPLASPNVSFPGECVTSPEASVIRPMAASAADTRPRLHRFTFSAPTVSMLVCACGDGGDYQRDPQGTLARQASTTSATPSRSSGPAPGCTTMPSLSLGTRIHTSPWPGHAVLTASTGTLVVLPCRPRL